MFKGSALVVLVAPLANPRRHRLLPLAAWVASVFNLDSALALDLAPEVLLPRPATIAKRPAPIMNRIVVIEVRNSPGEAGPTES